MSITGTTLRSRVIDRCPFCRYSLTGHPERASTTCPECGRDIDRQAILRWRRQQRRRVVISILVILVVTYAPFCAWVFFEDYPWGEYRWLWVKLLPVMPALLPGDLLSRAVGVRDEAGRLLVWIIVLIVMGAPTLWIATRSWRLCIVVAIVVLLASIALSLATRGAMLA